MKTEIYILVLTKTAMFLSLRDSDESSGGTALPESSVDWRIGYGTIHDQLGERMVCITPVGGLSGETVYLLETGVYAATLWPILPPTLKISL